MTTLSTFNEKKELNLGDMVSVIIGEDSQMMTMGHIASTSYGTLNIEGKDQVLEKTSLSCIALEITIVANLDQRTRAKASATHGKP